MTTPVASLPSKKWSIVAWASVAAISVIASYLLMLALALASLLLPLGLLSAGSLNFSSILLGAFGLVMGLTILWSLIPRRDKFEPPGIPIDLQRETELQAEIAAIAGSLMEDLPAEVYLIPDANAFVAQRGGILGIGSRRVMGLGLPLLQTLNISQFRAVLAHEFAHFYAGDTRLGPLVYNARSTMIRVFQNLGDRSPFIGVLARFAIIALAYTIIIKSLVFYWKMFMRLTQFVSRRQEFRSDELACHVAGSEALIEGLKTVNRSAVAVRPYWESVVAPVVQNGHLPPLAAGFGQFMIAPQIAGAAASHLEGLIKSPRTTPFDTHPPLSARIEKARALNSASLEIDGRPAICLIEDLKTLEMNLLAKIAPGIQPATLKPFDWETLGSDVYIPVWRNHTAAFGPFLKDHTVEAIPDLLKNLAPIANQLKDPPGLLLTREQRITRAVSVVQSALTLALFDHGWVLHATPGYVCLSHESLRFEPAQMLAQLSSGTLAPNDWRVYCEKAGIGNWPLAQINKAATA